MPQFVSEEKAPGWTSLTSTAVCSMQALEQRRRFRALRVPSSPRLISNAAHRTGRSSVPAGQASTTGFAACNAGAESSGIITFSIFSSRYAAGAGAASNLDNSSSIRSTDTQSRWAHSARAACPVGGSMAKPNRAANRYSRRMRRANPGKFLASAVGSLTQPLFARGQLLGQLKITKAQQEEARLSFEQALLNAGTEVNDALVQYHTARDKAVYFEKQIESLERAYKSTSLLMQHGTTTYLEVLTAQQGLLNAQLTQVANRFTEIQGVINLYQALGGGRE